MHTNVLVVGLFVLATVSFQSLGKIIMTPRNTESKVGDTAYFNCSRNLTSGEIFWYHDLKYIYTGGVIYEPYDKRFTVTGNSLMIRSVESGDAGEYICVDDDGFGERRSAHLVVIDSDPDCQSNMQPDGVIGQNIFNIPPDEVKLQCVVTYHGYIPPQMEWMKVGDNSSIRDSVTSNITSNHLIYTLTLKGDISLNNSSYICQTTRSTQNQYKCNSNIIKVLYFFGENRSELTVARGMQITCNDSSTFSCFRQWYYGNYTCPISCDETITTHMLGEYMCTVRCNVRGTDYFYEALKISVVEATAISRSLPSGVIAVATVVPISIIIISLLFMDYVRRQRRVHFRKSSLQTNLHDVEETDLCETAESHKLNGRVNAEEMELLHKFRKNRTLRTEDKTIMGVAMLIEKLFLVREKSSTIEVYDCKKRRVFSTDCKLIKLKELVAAIDICSCNKHNCLYVMDKKNRGSAKKLMKISPEGNLLRKWPTKGNGGGFLSVTGEGNVIITVQAKYLLLEYSHNGNLVRAIFIPECSNPWHAIKLENDRYIVSHGTIYDLLHRVCMVNKDGRVTKSFGRGSGSKENQLNMPFYLAVGFNGRFVVADLGNNRVFILDSNLKLILKIVPQYKQGFRNPRRIYLDETRLLVVVTAGYPADSDTEDAGYFSQELEEKESIRSSDHRQKTLRKVDLFTHSINIEPSQEIQLIGAQDEVQTKELNKIEEDCTVLVFNIQPLLK